VLADTSPNVRAALRFLRARCGRWEILAKALHLGESTLGNVAGGRKAVTPIIAFRIAKFSPRSAWTTC
jgi:plasmid maintenance system antidote protein VapI